MRAEHSYMLIAHNTFSEFMIFSGAGVTAGQFGAMVSQQADSGRNLLGDP